MNARRHRVRLGAAFLSCLGLALALGAVTHSAHKPRQTEPIRHGHGDDNRSMLVARKADRVTPHSAVAGSLSFAPAKSYALGKLLTNGVVVDLNRDGRPDIAAPEESGVEVLINRGDGRFEAPVKYQVAVPGLETIHAVDLNGDAAPDLVVGAFSVLLNRGDGTFEPTDGYRGDGSGVEVQDLNGDGKPDITISNRTSSEISVFTNSGDGHFRARRDFATPQEPELIAAADLNGDGRPDLVTANWPDSGPYTVSVFLGRSDGGYDRSDYEAQHYEGRVAVADLNGDDRPDLITGYNEKSIFVYPNDGNGGFPTGRSFTAGHGPYDLLDVEDMNGDSKPDLITESVGRVKPGIWIGLNRGDGRFGRRHRYETGAGYLADVNGDGRPDFVSGYVADGIEGLGPLSILLNRGDGRLEPSLVYMARRSYSQAIADLNGDNERDLVTFGFSGISVLVNDRAFCDVQAVSRQWSWRGGLSLAGARKQLARAGCRIGRIRYAHDPWALKGEVASQKPAPGAVRRRGAKVNLVISKGPK